MLIRLHKTDYWNALTFICLNIRRLRPRRFAVNVESLGESGSEDEREIVYEGRRDPGCPKPLVLLQTGLEDRCGRVRR